MLAGFWQFCCWWRASLSLQFGSCAKAVLSVPRGAPSRLLQCTPARDSSGFPVPPLLPEAPPQGASPSQASVREARRLEARLEHQPLPSRVAPEGEAAGGLRVAPGDGVAMGVAGEEAEGAAAEVPAPASPRKPLERPQAALAPGLPPGLGLPVQTSVEAVGSGVAGASAVGASAAEAPAAAAAEAAADQDGLTLAEDGDEAVAVGGAAAVSNSNKTTTTTTISSSSSSNGRQSSRRRAAVVAAVAPAAAPVGEGDLPHKVPAGAAGGAVALARPPAGPAARRSPRPGSDLLPGSAQRLDSGPYRASVRRPGSALRPACPRLAARLVQPALAPRLGLVAQAALAPRPPRRRLL